MNAHTWRPGSDDDPAIIELVMTEGTFRAVKDSIAAHGLNEDMSFVVARIVRLPRRTALLASALCLLSDDEAVRARCSVRPTLKATQEIYGSYIAGKLNEDNLVLATVHSHPFTSDAVLSPIDHATIAEDRGRWAQLVPGGVTFAWVVFGARCEHFDGVLVTPEQIVSIDRLSVVGTTHTVISRIPARSISGRARTTPARARTSWRA